MAGTYSQRRQLIPLVALSAIIPWLAGVQSCESDLDGDGWTVSEGDCNDDGASIYPGAPEHYNGIDDNCDGRVDEPEAIPCAGLSPATDPAINLEDIQGCLDFQGQAGLKAGVFAVPQGILMPSDSTLVGVEGQPTLRLVQDVAQWKTNYLVSLSGDRARVRFLTLDGFGRLPANANGAVVHIVGSGNHVDDSLILNSTAEEDGTRTTGVYFIGGGMTDNRVERCQITQHFYGVIFASYLSSSQRNVLTSSGIYENMCDGITLAGFGVVQGNEIYRNGYDCKNGPIPGAGIYSLWNANGAEVISAEDGTPNDIHDNCGHNIDIDGSSNFLIRGNIVRDPGYQWDGLNPWCGTGAAIALVDVDHFTIEHNDVSNNGRPWNAMGYGSGVHDPNGFFSPTGAANDMSDLPAGGNQAIAFFLASRKDSSQGVAGNFITHNAFRSACAAPCVGLGFATSRDTGFAKEGGGWSASTTNYFTENETYGSNIGSRRCGGNWYAANSTCTADPATSDADCNDDDYQHTTVWTHSDADCPAFE